MKVSWNLLNEFVDLKKFTVDQVANKLNLSGIEVEDISPLFDNSNLIVGEIIKCEPLPNKTEYKICQVSVGYEIFQVVCGAKNARENIKVVLAKDGAHLKHIDKKISKTLVHGIESFGMMCSLEEIGIKREYLNEKELEQIIELDNNAHVGDTNPLKYINASDYVLDLSITPNRADAYSLYGIAKEISSAMQVDFIWKEKEISKSFDIDFNADVNTSLVKAYSLSQINNVSVTKSSLDNRLKLIACGINPINNLIDAASLSMLIYNQPLHIYDADKIKSKNFKIVDDFKGNFKGLNNIDYTIDEKDIVILNDNTPAALGGILGDIDSSVSLDTKNILIESAIFDSVSIRKTSKRLQINSEAANRFSRNLVGDKFLNAHNLFASLLKNKDIKISKPKIFKNYVVANSLIKLEIDWLNKYLSTSFSNEQIINTLINLNFEVKQVENNLEVMPPSYRNDIKIREDIAEEVIRINGFDNIKTELPTIKVSKIVNPNPYYVRANSIRDYLVSNGLNEVITYSLIDQKTKSMFDCLLEDKYEYKLLNPATNLHEICRISIIPSLYKTINYNLNRQQKNINIFEVSKIYNEDDKEVQVLAIAMLGSLIDKKFYKDQTNDFFTIKGIVEGLFEYLGIDTELIRFKRVESDNKCLHPNKSVYIYAKETKVGVIGNVHPSIAKQADISNKVFIAEIILDELFKIEKQNKVFKSPSIYPSQERDISFVINEEILTSDIVFSIKSLNISEIKSIQVFDVYSNNEFGKNRKSVSINIVYQSEEKTLESQFVDSLTDRVVNEISNKFNTKLRF